MKINFYAFYQENNDIKERINLLSLFENNIINPQEHELDCNTYHLYLHKIDESTYLFTKTSDSELIKKSTHQLFQSLILEIVWLPMNRLASHHLFLLMEILWALHHLCMAPKFEN
ncbi:hypothetical protein Xbud_03521 [Xenorhabdus budapestensis]|uniref:Uncharacterized protein n=1 Tax=Xenorhabdus budapestensis TaxID=290110 RepID=A0A2D0IPK9_XENBU|nr:hypothetical protein Xbud_03521 [Xenorhabdus budapestensis]